MNEVIKIIQDDEGYWDVYIEDDLEPLLIDINYCPYCGKQLS